MAASGQIAHALDLSKEECSLVSVAGLLHDIGHGPFSHTLEFTFHDRCNMDHMRFTGDIIQGKSNLIDDRESDPLPAILERHGIDPKEVSNLITSDYPQPTLDHIPFPRTFYKGPHYLYQVIHSTLDADQIDYLMRDSHYTGVAHGIIDLARLFQTIELDEDQMVVHHRGLSALEGMLVARALMYTSVYFHKTVRITEIMLVRAVERMSDIEGLWKCTDGELLSTLTDPYQSQMVEKIKYRRLYKKCLVLTPSEVKEKDLSHLLDPKSRLESEKKLCKKAGIPDGTAFIDLPAQELLVSEPRMYRTDIKVLHEGTPQPLAKFSPVVRALERKIVPDWGMLVISEPKYREQVRAAIKSAIF